MSIKTIIFDFDGVLVESVNVKGEAFVGLYANESQDIQDQVLAYHNAHGGVTRYDKIRYYETRLLNRELTEERLQIRAQEFSDIVEERVVNSPWVKGAKEFLEKHYQTRPLYVASATPEEELRRIVEKRGMNSYFKAVYGAPEKKATHIRTALAELNLQAKEAVMIGDAMSDHNAAQETGTYFIGRKLAGKAAPFPEGTPIINDLTELEEVIDSL
jgi:phosphoglycolate phosphatase-like HAD superfamily hydrolase